MFEDEDSSSTSLFSAVTHSAKNKSTPLNSLLLVPGEADHSDVDEDDSSTKPIIVEEIEPVLRRRPILIEEIPDSSSRDKSSANIEPVNAEVFEQEEAKVPSGHEKEIIEDKGTKVFITEATDENRDTVQDDGSMSVDNTVATYVPMNVDNDDELFADESEDDVEDDTDDDSKWPSTLTPQFLRKICKEMKQYLTPELNDVLYLHYKGIYKLENLEEYTGLKCLWLECNAIRRIKNISHLKELRCLYLQQNVVHHISGLEGLDNLQTLNLANNQIQKITHLSKLPKLESLYLNNNKLTTAKSIAHLIRCPSISVLDLSNNRITDQSNFICLTISFLINSFCKQK